MKYLCVFLVLAGSLDGSLALAQQTVFNVPNADILENGKTYTELDLLYMPGRGTDFLNDQFLAVRAVHGLGSEIETGLNIGNFHEGGPAPSIVVPIKWKPILASIAPFSIALGGEAGSTIDPSHFVARGYLKLDWAGPERKLRVGVGPYLASSNFYRESTSCGVLATAEGKLSDRVTLAADWTSGDHSGGLLTGGIILAFGGGSDLLYFAVARGTPDKSYGALIEYGHYW